MSQSNDAPREFWLGPNGVILDIEDYERQKHNRTHQKGIHVLEASAYAKLKAERDELRAKLDVARAALEEVRLHYLREHLNATSGDSMVGDKVYEALEKLK